MSTRSVHHVPSPRLPSSWRETLFSLLKEDISERDITASTAISGLSYDNISSALPLSQCITEGLVGTATSVAAYHLLREVYRKFNDTKDKEHAARQQAVALAEWLATERRLERVETRVFDDGSPDEVSDLAYDLRLARNQIHALLGRLPTLSTLTRHSRFGPGASLEQPRRYRDTYYKYLRWPYACPSDALLTAREAIMSDERWYGAICDAYRNESRMQQWTPLPSLDCLFDSVLQPVDHNRVTFVPKTSEKCRTIAIEPSIGVYLQLGVDGFIRQRLRGWGIDLDDQYPNQRAARIGSIDGSLATLDLSSASDSISCKLVEYLLPADWWYYLSSLRARFGVLPNGDRQKYIKFSSMGNGFTFALESVIFAALSRAACYRSAGSVAMNAVLTYGDDIICPARCAVEVVNLLDWCGFVVNGRKSYTHGPFRESCGTDWYQGVNVRPFYVRKPVERLDDLYLLLNQVSEWFFEFHDVTDPRELRSWCFLHQFLPTGWALYGPADREDNSSWIQRRDQNWRYGYTQVVRALTSSRPCRYPTDWFFGRLKASHKPGRRSVSESSNGSLYSLYTDVSQDRVCKRLIWPEPPSSRAADFGRSSKQAAPRGRHHIC